MSEQEDLGRFLEPAPGIQCSHPEVVALARLTARGAKNDLEAAEKLFDFARDTVRYSMYNPFADIEDYLALNTLARGKGYCVQKSALLCALARALGIPARLSFADMENHLLPPETEKFLGAREFRFHCFVEWWVGGRWLKATPSFEKELCENRGWKLTKFNPGQDAMLHPKDLAGRPHITYLRYHGWRVGVPLDEIIAAWEMAYGKERVDFWRGHLGVEPSEKRGV